MYEPSQVVEQLEQSLKALQTDYVDLYQFHSGTDEMFQTPGLWEKLRQLVDTGAIRHLGVSVSKKNASLYQVEQASAVGAETIQVVYNRIERQTEERVAARRA